MHLARFSKTLAWLTLLGFTFPTTVAIGETHTTPHPPGIRTVGALPKHPPTVLQGQVSQTTIQTVQPYTGQVVDSSGKAIPQASIRLPALGWMSTTDAEGRFSLPPFPGSQAHSPWMLQISHPRFKPKTELVWPATPHNSPPHQAFRFTLQVGQHSLLLDQQLRHLGDGLWSKRSAHAGRLQAARNTSHAIYRVRFLMPKPQTTAPPRQAWITLGAVWGLDTAEAHADGHSQANAHSSPITV